MISLSFDDGWKNQYTRGFPILAKYNLKGTFYVLTGMPDYMLHEGEGRMTIEEWKILSENGHEIGAHTRSHPNLQLCLPGKLKREVVGSYKDLISLGFKPETFAYPYGRTHWFATWFLRRSPFGAARLAAGGEITKQSFDSYKLTGTCVMAHHAFEDIKKMIDEAEMKNSWLILIFHQIEKNPPPWGTNPEVFEKICMYLKEKNISVKTIQEGLKEYI